MGNVSSRDGKRFEVILYTTGSGNMALWEVEMFSIRILEQAGAELGQAQLKLGLDFNQI